MRLLAPLLLGVACTAAIGAGRTGSEPPAGPDRLALGERIYREGRLADGEPVRAFVSGDVALTGDQFSCMSCHQRSGIGTSEGWIVAPPVIEEALYAPRTSGKRRRPAYDDASLARALREGIDPGGRKLEAPMPRYELPDAEMAALIAYMKGLSRRSSAGVTRDEIHFATVVSDGVDARTMLSVLETFFRDKNGGTRHEMRRKLHGPWYRQQFNEPYRRWKLHVWRLEGPPESWGEQLEAYLERQPVFALLSGQVAGPWKPIHDFCERHRLPALLPNTDLPPAAVPGYYSRYFTEGPELEARVVAKRIRAAEPAGTVVQIRDASPFADRASAALERSLSSAGWRVETLAASGTTGRGLPRGTRGAAAVVAWVVPGTARALLEAARRVPAVPFYFSGTMAGDVLTGEGEAAGGNVHVVDRRTPEPDFSRRYRRVAAWASARKIEITDRQIAAQTYFAAMTLGEALMHVKFSHYYRDYLVELIDHTTEITRYCVAHSRPSFGPGQPYISKGCHLTHEVGGKRVTEWIVP